MAKATYIGINNTAKKTKEVYIGINNVARKVKKIYIGVNNIAKEVYKAATYTNFSSNPAPTSWSGTTTTANTVFTASNTYGSWRCSSSKAAYSSTYVTWKAFDGDTSTYHRTANSSNPPAITLTLPTSIYIKPTRMSLRLYYVSSGTKVEALKKDGTWVTIYTRDTDVTSATTINVNVTTSNYYSQFRLTTVAKGSTAARVYEFQITNGEIEDNR